MSTPLLEIDNSAVVPTDVSSLIGVIERAATNPEIDADKMEKLVGLYERLMAYRARAAFNAAFAELQSELPEIAENGEIKVGDTVRSKYARFEDIHDIVKPMLKRHGFSIMFKPRAAEEGQIHMQAVLMHREGHSEDADLKLPADTSGSKNSVQSMGSSETYAKRYLIVPMLNIKTCGVDDDGQAGGTKTITEDQVMELQSLITEVGQDRDSFLKYFKVDALPKLPLTKYGEAIAALKKKQQAKAQQAKGKKA